MKKTEFTCSLCGEHKVHESDFTTGYGTNNKGEKHCFECCGKQDAQQLAALPLKEKMCLYLDQSKRTISNWPGTLSIPIGWVDKGRHNIAGVRYDVYFHFEGFKYHGVQYGNNTQICHIKKVKA